VPFLFVPPTHEFSNPGRAAGLYVNANLAGTALSVGMLISLPITRGFHRFALIMVTGAGVFLTFSRASILAWILIVALLTMARMISGKQLASAVLTSFLISAALIITGKSTGIEINVRNIEERLAWFKILLDVGYKHDEASLWHARLANVGR
jgi:hypothetical protein